MPTAKKKPVQSGVLVKASKVNVFQVAILVSLFVIAGVVYKVYSHGSSYPATVKIGVTGLPTGTNVTFKADRTFGSCGTSFAVATNSSRTCTSTANMGANITYPTHVTVGGRVYSAYNECAGGYSLSIAAGGGCGGGDPANGSFSISDAPDSNAKSMDISYRIGY